MTTKIKKAMILVNDGKSAGSQMTAIDVIEYEGSLWVVPEWLDYPKLGISKPARIVRIDQLRYSTSKLPWADYFLTTPVPKAVLDSLSPSSGVVDYEVVVLPDIKVRTPPSAMH
jgi:hypothetical protein